MNTVRRTPKLALCALAALCLLPTGIVHAGPYMAFSMREACERVRSGERQNAELMLLGGVTRLVGVVHDSGSGDVVLVGQVTAADRKLALEDLVVALRAVLVHDEWPMVSIDKTPETAATGRQIVRFGGGIENSSFGRDLTEADITLKKMALGHLPVEELGASSYFANLSRYIQTEGPSADRVSCRFWFYPADAERALSGRQGVFVIKELRVGARAEILSAVVGGRPVTDLSRISSHPAEEFASGLTRSYEALARSRPELARVKGLYYALAAARGIESLDVRPAMAYWLTDFPVRPVTTLTHYPLLKRESGPQSEGGGFTLSGGVQLKALVVRLSEGDVTALRDIVLNARPGPRALTWRVPLGAWAVPGAADTEPDDGSMAGVVAEDVAALKVKWGCLMEAGFPRGDASPGSTATGSPSLPGLQRGTTMPRFGVEPTLPQYTPSTRPHNLGPPINQGTPQATTTPAVPDVGGVLLRAEPDARLSPIQGATWDGKGNQFGLVLSSGAAELPVQFADDWRTILLSIYGGEDPGLSLDPGPTRNIMLVRTIGKVQGTRLALVMLEADRLLKCYSLGRDNRTGEPMAPKIAGYKPLAAIVRDTGLRYNGAMTRTWFVPRPVPISEERGRLCFGEVTIEARTEYDVEGLRGECEPAARKYADFFTRHYQEFAALHPELQELREYAKLVALAKYVRGQGVPLNWLIFALPKPERPVEVPPTELGYTIGGEETGGLEIWGGVDLAADVRPQYDFAAMPAATQRLLAMEAQAAAAQGASEAYIAQQQLPAVQSEAAGKPHTVVHFPARLRTAKGKIVEIATDASIADGRGPILQLTRVRGVRSGEEFGGGWGLFVPYRLTVASRTVSVGAARLPDAVTLMEQLTQRQVDLPLTQDEGGAPCYRSEACWWVNGVYPTEAGGWVMEDYWGSRFSFDPSLRPVMVDLGRDNRWAYEWGPSGKAVGQCALPYALKLEEATASTSAGPVPGKLVVEDRMGTHQLLFRRIEGETALYGADRGPWAAFTLPLAGGAFRLVDASGRALVYDSSGVVLGIERQAPTGAAGRGYWDIVLRYGPNGRAVGAELRGEGDVHYVHDVSGDLRAVVDTRGRPMYYASQPSGVRSPALVIAVCVGLALMAVTLGAGWRRRVRPGQQNHPPSVRHRPT